LGIPNRFNLTPSRFRTAIGLPGSGTSWSEYQPYSSEGRSSSRRQVSPGEQTSEPVSSDQGATVIDSAPIQQLVANSTIEIAGALNESMSTWRRYKLLLGTLAVLLAVGGTAVVGSSSAIPPLAAFAVMAGALIIIGAIGIHGRESSIVSLDYDLSTIEAERFDALSKAFAALAGCGGIWRIPLEREQADWKRNAEA
ncbi:hypothetical protein, partial [Bradyrhizobium guangdongense]|uniref:hypothetical protein n=1 Tax=Bradyrhizobium guangdongense TaxID=1325090 RepID=UPI001AEC759D